VRPLCKHFLLLPEKTGGKCECRSKVRSLVPPPCVAVHFKPLLVPIICFKISILCEPVSKFINSSQQNYNSPRLCIKLLFIQSRTTNNYYFSPGVHTVMETLTLSKCGNEKNYFAKKGSGIIIVAGHSNFFLAYLCLLKYQQFQVKYVLQFLNYYNFFQLCNNCLMEKKKLACLF